MARETETLFYNIRMIIDSKVESEPRTWLVSKVNRISPNGICRVTLTQDIFDQHKDYIEKDEYGNIIGQWANYFASAVEPIPVAIDDPISSPITSRITCTGKPQFKIGGSAKTFTVTFFDNENQEITDHAAGSWTFSMDGNSLPNILFDLTTLDEQNKIKLKFLGDDSYIGKVITITNTSGEIVSSIDVEVIAL